MLELGACFTIAVLYVASLYIWRFEYSRDHPETIKRRFVSVTIVMAVSPIFVYLICREQLSTGDTSLWKLLGFRSDHLLQAFGIPLMLTVLLFLGPISVQAYNGGWRTYFRPSYWIESVNDLVWVRNHLVAPLSEEFTFRACMLPILLQKFSSVTAMLIVPLFFGVAHLHHFLERIRGGLDKRTAIIFSTFQILYTTLFGIYSAYLFVRTGHFMAPFIAHAFCNHMGFPDIQDLFAQPEPIRKLFFALYVLGLVGFIALLPYASSPAIYGNSIWL